jgi:hypothetical protein
MPIVTRIYGGVEYTDPRDWQHQPGDHSDTGILPLLTPITGTAAVAFGFSVSATATQTFSATAAVTFGFAVEATATVTSGEPLGPCAYDYPQAYDTPGVTYDCGAGVTGPQDWFPPLTLTNQPQPDDDDLLMAVAVMRSRLRL